MAQPAYRIGILGFDARLGHARRLAVQGILDEVAFGRAQGARIDRVHRDVGSHEAAHRAVHRFHDVGALALQPAHDVHHVVVDAFAEQQQRLAPALDSAEMHGQRFEHAGQRAGPVGALAVARVHAVVERHFERPFFVLDLHRRGRELVPGKLIDGGEQPSLVAREVLGGRRQPAGRHDGHEIGRPDVSLDELPRVGADDARPRRGNMDGVEDEDEHTRVAGHLVRGDVAGNDRGSARTGERPPHRNRHALERPDRLRRAIFEDLKVCGGEIGDRPAVTVTREHGDFYQFDAGAHLRSRLRGMARHGAATGDSTCEASDHDQRGQSHEVPRQWSLQSPQMEWNSSVHRQLSRPAMLVRANAAGGRVRCLAG